MDMYRTGTATGDHKYDLLCCVSGKGRRCYCCLAYLGR